MSSQQLLNEAHEMLLDLYNRYHLDTVPALTSVDVRRQGNFTVVLLNGAEAVGVSKRNPVDSQRSDVGTRKALYRAVQHLVKVFKK